MNSKAKSLLATLWILTFTLLLFGGGGQPAETKHLVLPGLSEPVEIYKDPWGISHIYARNQEDLFFAQGFNAASDRLFQLELWRRQATGTLAEILGPRALKNDIGARLLSARVDMAEEMEHYHPDGGTIIPAFVAGINACIGLTRENPGLLPLEFRVLGIRPEFWTPEVVVSRHNGLFRNAGFEIDMVRAVQLLDSDTLGQFLDLHPGRPELELDPELDPNLFPDDLLQLYSASRSRVRFLPEDIPDAADRAEHSAVSDPPPGQAESRPGIEAPLAGSNNWVLSGDRTFSGFPLLANDPHRSHQIPSLRYWVHLCAPGWNVIGGGEPALPGISIGHNEYGGWGLTIFAVDQEDLYVYSTNPDDPDLYLYRDRWEAMTVRRETIEIKGADPVTVDLKFTRHGPVLYEDRAAHRAFALRAAWLEVGGAPYLASLRMDQARTWEEFREACTFSHTPSENMIWAGRDNTIGWQAVGIAPRRKGWSGLLPVPGDGRYEWEGYLPIRELPHLVNPPAGFFATANQDNIPRGYPHALGYVWTEPFRFARIQEVLSTGRLFTVQDMMALQKDVLSIPARILVPLLAGIKSEEGAVEKARQALLGWDCFMTPDSVPASVYQSWEHRLTRNVWERALSEDQRTALPRRPLKKVIDLLTAPNGMFGDDPLEARDDLLLSSLAQAVDDLIRRLGPDMKTWRYGQPDYHHILIRHALSDAVNDRVRAGLDAGPYPRGGNGFTVDMTTSRFNQTSGASFRIIIDLGDWDRSVGTNCPGQSGDPENPHYSDLIGPWAEGKYFPVLFSRKRVAEAAGSVLRLEPDNR